MNLTTPDTVSIAMNLSNPVVGDAVYSAFAVQQFEDKVVVWREVKGRVRNLDNLLHDPVVVANLEIGGGEYFIPAYAAEQILDRLHLCTSSPYSLYFINPLPFCRPWRVRRLSKLARAGNITVLAVAQEFIDQPVEHLQRGIHWSLTVTDGTLYLTVGGKPLETTLEKLG